LWSFIQMNRSHLASVALTVAGAVFGWATAAGHLDFSHKAPTPAETSALIVSLHPAKSCCDEACNPSARAFFTAHKAGSFNLDEVMRKLQEGGGNK
jgi:hypothetical protein